VISRTLTRGARVFDFLESHWETLGTQRRIVDAGLGITAALFALALTWEHGRVVNVIDPDER